MARLGVFEQQAAGCGASPIVSIRDLSFTYPGSKGEPVLDGISLDVAPGAFCVVTGPTGCGKTTLLRCLKPELAPAGIRCGSIEVLGCELTADSKAGGAMDPRRSATDIGFVMQDPAAQIVCDTVWHELAFGLESIGMPQPEMRRRIAEVAHFFGIEPILHASTDALSGGQQQLVNLAAVLALRPRLIVLDEPTAQLDPNARRQFLFLLGRVNRELGITVIMSTHLPEATEPYATQALELGDPVPAAERTKLATRLAPRWHAWGQRHGNARVDADSLAVAARDLRLRYDRGAPEVLRGADIAIERGCVHAIVGGNGCGKSTLLKALAGILRPQRGRVDNACAAHQAYLPQDPKTLLVCDTVAEELSEWQARVGYRVDDVRRLTARLGLSGLDEQHPFDLSGGQQQKLALAKLLLCDPELLFLDEPTKGLDPAGTAEVIRILRGLADEGRAVVLVTHDLDVAFAVADEVSVLFDGEVACTEPARTFFERSLLYRPHDRARLYGELLEQGDGEKASGAPDGDGSRASRAAETPAVHPAPDRSDTVCPKPQHRGSFLVEALALTAVPVALVAAGLSGFSQTALLSFAVVIAALAVFFTSYEKGGARLHEVMPTVVLAALAAAGRILFAAVPSVKPVSAIAIIAGVALGRRSGFMVGALAALVSNFFFGQGPWTPWQMYAWGLVGYGAGALAQAGLFGGEGGGLRSRLGGAALLAYGFISSVAYGWVLNAWSVLGFLHTGLGFNLLAVYAASLPFDVAHGVATVVFLAALYVPWRRKLKRI